MATRHTDTKRQIPVSDEKINYKPFATDKQMRQHLPLLFFYALLGFSFQFTSVAMRYWMMETVKVSPAQMAAMFGVSAIPWCLKPVYGFISDSKPLFGYRRRSYMVGFSFMSAYMWILLPLVPHDEFIITLVMTLASGSMCFADVMADSLLVEVARVEEDAQKGTIQSWSWMMRFGGGLLAAGTGAIAYDNMGAENVFLLNSMVPVAIAISSMFIPDERTDRQVHWRQTGTKLWTAVRKPGIYKPAFFIFLICVTPSCGGAMTFFYERELRFTPDEFGALDVMEYVVKIFGTFVYKRYLRHVSFIRIFGWALLMSFLLENTLLLLVLHVNRDMGIPDYVFAFAERVVLTLVVQFVTMPMVVLGARLCPKGVEGTLYALLMSVTNFGGVISTEWGSMFTGMLGVTSTNFTNLWKLLLLCNLCDLIPLAALPLLRGLQHETGPDAYI